MRDRRVAVMGLTAFVVAAMGACSSESSAPVESATPDESVSAPADDWDVTVTASGRGGLIDSVEVVDAEHVGGSGEASPWVRFGLRLNHCCSEPNSLVFSLDQRSVELSGSPMWIEGPACESPIECRVTERRLMLTPFEPAVAQFELFRPAEPGSGLAAGTFHAEISPVFHWVGDVIDPEPMPITFRVDVSTPVAPPSGDSTPTVTAHRSVTVVGGGLDLLPFPFAGVADSDAELSALTSGSSKPIDIDGLAIDWDTQAAVVVAIGSDLCPPLLDDIEVADGVATPIFVNAGYLMCEQPLVPYTAIAAVDRRVFDGVTKLVLPAVVAATGEDTVVDVAVTPASGEPQLQPIVAEFGEGAGEVPLPRRGEAAVGALDDGTPVFVVHHHDGTVSALDPRGESQNVGGLYQVVRWVAHTRTFLGHGAWDEYGRRLDGFRASDLVGYATRVVDDIIEIGSKVPAPAGSPITATGDPPAMADVDLSPGPMLDLEAATALDPGATAWIDAIVYALPDGAHVCSLGGEATATLPPVTVVPVAPGCPPGAPVAYGVAGTPGYSYTYFGPLLATRASAGFERIATTGGYGGNQL